MNCTAEKIVPIQKNTQSEVRECRVVTAEAGSLFVILDDEARAARTAFSCLINPEPGDLALCVERAEGTVYILGIIERPDADRANISLPAESTIRSRGNTRIVAGESLNIAAKQLNCLSGKVLHQSKEAVVSYDQITAQGKELQANYGTVRLISKLINTFAHQVIDRFQGYIRSTEGQDMVKAGRLSRKAEGLSTMDAEHTMINSKECTKIDGEKILMG